MRVDFSEQLETVFQIAASPLGGREFRTVCQRWLECFCHNVKEKTGRWVYRGYRWHAYSFDYEQATCGERALNNYRAMPIEPFFLFHETTDLLYACTAAAWPDMRELSDDIYIFPRTLAWTFVMTHEMGMGLGPYFAFPSAAPQ